METVLVVGIDSVVGANIAALLADHYPVVAISVDHPSHIAGCECRHLHDQSLESVRCLTSLYRPGWVVYCGPSSRSAWFETPQLGLSHQPVAVAAAWATAAAGCGAELTVVSSDSVFTGPRLFHDEESASFCESGAAQTILHIEEKILSIHPQPLIARTNAFGWSPGTDGDGWIEQTLEALAENSAGPFDCIRHATPILATDLAAILEHAYQEKLHGRFHIAGGERINPAMFVRRMADTFGHPNPRSTQIEPLTERSTGFGRGETSLHTQRIRHALSISMPMPGDGLQRLLKQQENGFVDRLRVAVPDELHELVA